MGSQLERIARVACAAGIAALAFAGGAARATIALNQIDDFQNGTTMNWSGGDLVSNVSTGGPAGGGDKYLQIVSNGGFGGGSKLATDNTVQWIGNYQAAGVNELTIDLLSPPSNGINLPIRVVIFGPTGGRLTSITPFALPDDGAWHHAVFPIGPSDLVNVSGTDSYASTITGVQRLMFRYDDSPASSGGTTFAGTLGLDNIKAAAIPEPSTLGLLVGLPFLLRRTRRA
ncbi:MAG: hypothetical protein JWN24_1373 [Phycisphaerales bacterium]|nr:hypothetical protein [Phycisphaerales bacterium]